MPVHANSRLSYQLVDLTERQRLVMAVFASGAWLTDREVSERLGWELYVTRPRVTECVEMGQLVEVGSTKDPVTGRKVRICALAEAKP